MTILLVLLMLPQAAQQVRIKPPCNIPHAGECDGLAAVVLDSPAAVPYHRVAAPKGMGWQSCNCRDVHYIGKGVPASGELRIEYKKLWPDDLTGKPISCQITNGPPKTTITLKEEAWDHITFKFSGPGKSKEMEWSCDFVVPK